MAPDCSIQANSLLEHRIGIFRVTGQMTTSAPVTNAKGFLCIGLTKHSFVRMYKPNRVKTRTDVFRYQS